MSWSYTDTLSAARDRVRVLVGDTDTTNQVFTNEEIDDALDMHDAEIGRTVGWLFRILSHDPDRLQAKRAAACYAFSVVTLMRLYAKIADAWTGDD